MELYSAWFLQDGYCCLRSIVLAFLLSTLTFLVFRSSYCRFRAQYSNRRGTRLPPSPPGLPLIGNLHQLGPLHHRTLRALSQKHGPLMLLQLGQVPTLVVSSAEGAREVMKEQDLAFATRPFSKVMHVFTYRSSNIGFSPYGEHWRQAKKAAVVHLLGPRRVQSFRRVREEQVALMLEKVAAASSPASTVDMSEVFHSLVTSVVSKVVIGSSLAGGERARVFEQMMEEIGKVSEGFRFDEFPSLGSWLAMLPGVDSKLWKLFERWDAFHKQILEEREQRRAQQGDEGLEGDFVDVLISMHRDPDADFPASRGDISALWTELVGVGAETTLATLEWAMAELVKNPRAMERARREAREIIGGKPMGTEDDVARMSYLKAVIKETLRLHPAAPLLLPRESMKDAQVLGYDVPRKTRVLINAWAISRDPCYWGEAPEEFQPERFLDSPIDFRGNDFQFIPFGAGRRICPGINFSLLETELALANLLHRFAWRLPRGMRVEHFELGESPGIVVRLKPSLRLVATACAPTLVPSDVGM